MKIYALNHAENLDNELFNELLQHASDEKQKRIKRLTRFGDAKGMLAGELLVKVAAYRELGLFNINFDTNQFGKPFLKGIIDFHFNISHSGDWAVCAVDREMIGIDVEKIRPIDLAIANKFFSKEECRQLNSKQHGESLNYFYDLWTLKESYIKAIGEGLSMPLDSFTIDASNNVAIKVVVGQMSLEWHFKKYDLDSNYKMAVCAKLNDFPQSIIIERPQKVLEELTVTSKLI